MSSRSVWFREGVGVRRAGLAAIAVAGAIGAAAAAPQSGPPPAAARTDAGYVRKDGSLQIVASASMAAATRAVDAVFVAQHPDTGFVVLAGDNYTAMSALTFDRSLVAPMGCAYTRIGLGNNLKIAAEPLAVRVAHAGLAPGAGVSALGIIVNEANPVASLSLAQLARLFVVGAGGGDIATWGQAGVKGALAERAVEPLGPLASDERESDDPQAGEFLGTMVFGGLTMNHRYQGLPHSADVVERVRENPAAVGIVALNAPHAGVKVVALKLTDAGEAVLPTAEAIGSGRYPLDRFVYVYLRLGKGMPADALAKEYARAALSEDGQRGIASSAEGYIPMNAGELAQERALVDP